MKKWTGFIVIWAIAALAAGFVSGAAAQEEPAVPAEPGADTGDDLTEPAVKRHFGLYLAAGFGSGKADEVNTSIAADEVNRAVGFVELDDLSKARAAVGWQLPEGKGDFRLMFQGFKEEGYTYNARGVQHRIEDPGSGTVLVDTSCGEMGDTELPLDDCLVPWWFVNAQDGNATASRVIPQWNVSTDDADNDGQPDFGPCVEIGGVTQCGEISYDFSAPDRVIESKLPDTLQNQIQTVDLVYGREFGGRRYSSRWFGGLRYFAYEGNLVASAWLNLDTTGEGFTDGGLLQYLYLHQETTGFGPMGSWEVDFNFLDRGVVLFIVGMASFTFNSMEVDSGPFFQVTDSGSSSILFEDRLQKSLDKSTWQNAIGAGIRLNLKMGLQFEAGFTRNGFLDVLLTPDLLQLGTTNESPQTTTQDFVFDSAHVQVGFQF